MNFLDKAFSYIKDSYTDQLLYFPSNIRISLLITLFCVIAIAELYLFILFRRIRQVGRRREEKIWLEKISDIMANLVTYDESEDANEIVQHFYPQFKKLPLRHKVVKRILIAEILAYHRNLMGKPVQVLAILYRKLNLHKLTQKKIANNNWEVRVEGIREAKEMDIVELVDSISTFTDDENGHLRMEAQAAYVKLSTTDPFHFLDRARERILDWHQLVLFEIITKDKRLQIPSFSKWLRSPNDTVVLLCLKLIDHFMQFDAESEIKRLLKHHNPNIVKKSIEIIGKLELSDAEKDIFEVYFDHPEDIKLVILKALGRISSGNYNDFLASRIHSSSSMLKRTAFYAIQKNPEYGPQKLRELYLQTTLENQALIKHVLDNRIKE